MVFVASLIQDYPSWGEMGEFSTIGFLVVMFVLSVLSMLTTVIGLFFTLLEKMKERRAAQSAVQASSSVPETSIPDNHAFVVSAAVAAVLPELRDEQSRLVAVLSAAAATVLDGDCRVISYKMSADSMAYARQGRMQIFESKNYIPTRMK